MIEPTTLEVSGDRIVAVYEFANTEEEARQRADALRVEQTIEFPAALVPNDDIQNQVVGRIETVESLSAESTAVTVSYAVETSGFELPQLLNVLWGNSSLLPGIKLVDFALPASMLRLFPGPRFGVAGLRKAFDAPQRPLLATALKPMGLSSKRLAKVAYELALGGIDMIKDDHSLANQPFAPYAERVQRCSEAVAKANAQTGMNAIYMPSINAPFDRLEERLHIALDAGVGGLLVLPGLTGFDHLRTLAARDDVAVPIMGHPAFLGSFTSSPHSGFGHSALFGKLMRLVGSDLSIFPNFGGRFSFTRAECRGIADALAEPAGGLQRAMPSPGGGMTLERVGDIVEFFGNDVALLIGGGLHAGDDLVETAAGFRQAIDG